MKTNFELGLRAQSVAEMIGGKVMETGDGFAVETTMGGLTKYNIFRQVTNLNTHCAVMAITRPMYETDAEVYIVFESKRAWEHAKKMMEREIRNRLDEDMNGEIEWMVCPIEELLANETLCWLPMKEEGSNFNGWYTVKNHHHKVKFVNQYDLMMGQLDKDKVPF